MAKLTYAQRQAAYEALGNDEIEDSQICNALAEHVDKKTVELRRLVKNLEQQFQAAGGRGVELAEDLDNARIALAVRTTVKKKPELHQRMFKATIYFTVDENAVGQPVTVEEVKDFLEDALVVDVDHEEWGNPIALLSTAVN